MAVPDSDDAPSDIELRVPAQSAYVAVLRMTTAGIAARLDFTLDDIEELRMAVGEACALILETAPEGADLRARFDLGEGDMSVQVSAPTTTGEPLDQDSLGWQVLDTLASAATAEVRDGLLQISLTVKSSVLA